MMSLEITLNGSEIALSRARRTAKIRQDCQSKNNKSKAGSQLASGFYLFHDNPSITQTWVSCQGAVASGQSNSSVS